MIERPPHRMQRETPQKKFLRLGIDGLVVALVMLNWIATQLVAAALHYPPFFMGRILGRIYQPFAWWWWQYHWPHSSVEIGRNIIPLERAWKLCDHIVFYPVIAILIVGGVISGLLLKSRGPADVHGSAEWGNELEAKEVKLLW
jgi:hypothetical protein